MENLFSFVDDSDEQKGQIMTLPFLLCHALVLIYIAVNTPALLKAASPCFEMKHSPSLYKYWL